MEGLEEKKLLAEIENLRAQAEKAKADSEKTSAERAHLKRSTWEWSLEAIKLLGAVILGVGGVMAAISGYQLSEAKKALTDLAIARDTTELAALTSQKQSALDSLASITTQVDSLQRYLRAARQAGSGNGALLDEAIGRAAKIGLAVSTTDLDLRSNQRSASAGTPRSLSDYLVGLQTLGLPDSTRLRLNEQIRAAGYGLHPTSDSYGSRAEASWFAPTSTVFFYSPSARPTALKVAQLMKSLTGRDFAVTRGAGSGVDPSQRDVTLFVDYVK